MENLCRYRHSFRVDIDSPNVWEVQKNLPGDGKDGLSGLGHASGHARHDHVDSDREEGGEDRGEGVLGTTVLWHLNHLLNDPADQVHQAHRGRKGEARDDRVEGLCFQFLGNEVNSLESLGGHVSHGVVFILYIQKIIYSGNNSSFSTIFLYFGLLTI